MAFQAIRPGWVNEVRPATCSWPAKTARWARGDRSAPCSRRDRRRNCGFDQRDGVFATASTPACRRSPSQPAAIFDEGDIAEIDFIGGTVRSVRPGGASRDGLALSLAEIVVAGGLIPMLVEGGYIQPKPFAIRTA
jgi:hypothetical protein